MTEDEWLDLVMQTAHAFGWLAVHFHKVRIPARGGGFRWLTPVKGDKGSPDLLLAHPRRHLRILAELKVPGGHFEPGQREWLDALGPSDGRTAVVVWRPEDEREVRAILRGEWWPA